MKLELNAKMIRKLCAISALLFITGHVLLAEDRPGNRQGMNVEPVSVIEKSKTKKYFEEFFMVTYEYSPLVPCQLKFGGGRRWGGTFNLDVINHNRLSIHYKKMPEYSPSSILCVGGSAFYSFHKNLHLLAGPGYMFEPSAGSSSGDGMNAYNGWKLQNSLVFSIKGFIITGGANYLFSKYHKTLVDWSVGIGFKIGSHKF